ncbi:hypothetical protein BGX34_011968 [Mortierella sp. NVP85]|nr:hypothetical protein BGX34_011968 [Mortierella sp. NVP85]
MSANHSRQGKDLQRKVVKAEAAAAVAVPPQKSKGESQSSLSKATAAAMAEAIGEFSGNGAATGGPASSSSSHGELVLDITPNQYQQGGASGPSCPHHQYTNNPSYQEMVGGEPGRDLRGGDSGSEDSGLSSSSSEIPGNSSSTMIGESFTVIKNRSKDESDPFYKF